MTGIVQAGEEHIEQVAELFDLYRQFYAQPSDRRLARDYIRDRIA